MSIEDHLLVGLAGGDLARQVSLFIIQVLELEMETVNLLAGFCSGLLGLAHAHNRIPVLAPQTSQKSKQLFLLARGCQSTLLRVIGQISRGVEYGQQFHALIASLGAEPEHGQQRGIGDDIADGHGGLSQDG